MIERSRLPLLPTTTVGSFPKPESLQKARTRLRHGSLSPQELMQLEQEATRNVIALQEQLGIDVLVHGEMERGDMEEYFAERLDGFAEGGLVRSYGNRYYRKPVVVGPIGRKAPLTVDSFRYAQSLTDKPIKGIFTGPYTLCDWAFNDYYPDRRSLVLDLARVLHDEAVDLVAAGCRFIQIDEPALSTRPEEMDLAKEALGIITRDLDAHTITHICYGHFEEVYPAMLELPVDQIDLELANNQFELFRSFAQHPFTKEIGLGVIDVHTHTVEPVEVIQQRIQQALDFLRPEQIYVDPDCGLKTRTWQEAEEKLRNMVAAVEAVRAAL